MAKSDIQMTSNRPYLIRGLYEWIVDNGLTPHIVADATADHVQVPMQAVKAGKVVLNIAAGAVRNLELGNDYILFHTRFTGKQHSITLPVDAVLAVHARENGQGMLFPQDESPTSPGGADNAQGDKGRPHLKVVK